jgi:hypothetical protein
MEVNFHTFPSGKRYVYVVKDGAPVFLRNILFITRASNSREIAVVREWGARSNKGTWEPPKGQLEWKEIGGSPRTMTSAELVRHMRAGILREIAEESKFLPKELTHFHRLPGFYMQDWPESGLPGAKFMYQYWHATASDKAMANAQARMKELVDHPDWKAMLPADLTEKDAVQWWKPEDGWTFIRSAFSKKMTVRYYSS